MSRKFWIALWWSLAIVSGLTALVQEVVAGGLGFTVNTAVYWAVLYVALRRVGKRA